MKKNIYKKLSLSEEEIEQEKRKVMYYTTLFKNEYQFLIKKLQKVDRETQETNPDTTWISD
jgi:hypothetical protein